MLNQTVAAMTSTLAPLDSPSMNSTSLPNTTGGMLNQTLEPVTSEVTSITPTTIAAVSVVMVISSIAVVMNSGILVMTYWLKLINKDYRMIYYVLITATDLTFSIHSIINCVTIILRNVEFFKFKVFCLILQCSGVVSYQISAMSIILLIFDLVYSVRNPFSTETKLRKRVSYLACVVAIFTATSLAYGPFIWWYGSGENLEFCSIANVYGPHFTDYHKLATVVLALLFLLMVVASSLLLKTIKSSIRPRRPKSFKIPSIFRVDPDAKSPRKWKSARRNALNNDKLAHNQAAISDEKANADGAGPKLPDVVAGIEKVTTSLSNYVGIDNKAFDREERMTLRNKLLNIDAKLNADETCTNNGAANDGQLDGKDSAASGNQYTDAYKSVAGLDTEATIHQDPEQKQIGDEDDSATNQSLAQVNHGFDNEEDQSQALDGTKQGESVANTIVASRTEQLADDTEDIHRLSVDVEAPYRGSIDKVRRLTGTTDQVEPEIKKVLSDRSEKRKKFLRACTTVAAFMTAYLGCGLPYYILSVIELSQGTATEDSVQRRTVRMICAIFLYLLPIVDPILYTSRFAIIRQKLGRVMPRCCRCWKQNND